jgi:hypothetical protein
MADRTVYSGVANINEKWIDQGDGSFSRATSLGAADRSALSGTYRRATAVGATAGDGLFVTNVTTAGTITVTLSGGGSLVVFVPLGSTILPLAATAAVLTTAVGGTFQSLFYS